MTYPGRLIIMGRDGNGDCVVLIYAITGRSPSSQARKLIFQNGKMLVVPTDEETLRKGDPDLLVYPAISVGNEVAIGNGKHTESINGRYDGAEGCGPILERALADWSFEPDPPHHTPRIAGIHIPGSMTAALGAVRCGRDGNAEREIFEFPLTAGRGKVISTYAGVNTNPLPSFTGGPRDVGMEWSDPREAAEAVYDALGPSAGDDLRVAVGSVFIGTEEYRQHIVNRRKEGC